jgi:hypothetical protein
VTHHADHEEFQLVDDVHPVTVTTEHAGATTTMTTSLAGVTTWSSITVRNDDGSLARWTLSDFSLSTGALLRSQEYTPAASDTFHVVVREYRDGQVAVLREFETPRAFPQGTIEGPLPVKPIGNKECSKSHFVELEHNFIAGLMKGEACMERIAPDIAATATAQFHSKPPTLQCGSFKNEANMNIDDNVIEIDTNHFMPRLDDRQQATMWHEWLHNSLGAHDAGFLNLDLQTRAESDRVAACTVLCFPGIPVGAISPEEIPPKATRCACAKCLNTNPCDKRCAGFAKCSSSHDWDDCGWSYKDATPLGDIKGTKCGDASGTWAINGKQVISGQGTTVTTTTQWVVKFPPGTLAGSYDYESLGITVSLPPAGTTVVVTGKSNGGARIVVNPDGSVTMTLDPALITLTGIHEGHTVVTVVPSMGWTYVWQPGRDGECPGG